MIENGHSVTLKWSSKLSGSAAEGRNHATIAFFSVVKIIAKIGKIPNSVFAP
jgi:hypothetical protein